MTDFYPEGQIINTQENINILSSMSSLMEAYKTRKIIESIAKICDAEHNLIVNLGEIKGVIPREEGALGIKEGTVRDIAIISKVNHPVCFIIKEITKDDNGNDIAVLSRRAAQEVCFREYVSKLRPGDVIKARITHMESFGVFADIGCGITSFLPIDTISVSRISHPGDRFKNGMNIYAVIKSVEDGRINLTHKELLGTWEENAKLISIGETVAGTIRSLEEYGVFVELTPNLAGLAELKEGISEGQQASVYIKNILPEKMKVKLVIIDAFDSKRTIEKPKYFFSGNHMDEFIYSPAGCSRIIATKFTT